MGKRRNYCLRLSAAQSRRLHFSGHASKSDKPFVKIGMELFYAEGPEIVREIKGPGPQDLPGSEAARHPQHREKGHGVLSRLDVDMCNLHAFGTVDMMKAALEGLTRPDGTRPLLIAVDPV